MSAVTGLDGPCKRSTGVYPSAHPPSPSAQAKNAKDPTDESLEYDQLPL